MSKKKNAGPDAQASTPAAKKTPARKKAAARVPENSLLKTTIMSAPRALDLYSANSFMRTTAFSLQKKVKTAITGLNRKTGKGIRRPDPRLNLTFGSSAQPRTRNSFLAEPINRLKLALLVLVAVGGIGFYKHSQRVNDSIKSLGDAADMISQEKNWVSGMMVQTNGVPDGNDKDGTLLPPRAAVAGMPAPEGEPVAKASDTLPVETPAATPAPKRSLAEAKSVKMSKSGKKAKAKASRSRARGKGKALAH